jgi:polysaccharide pyruvyl transferase WcaK-like protein
MEKTKLKALIFGEINSLNLGDQAIFDGLKNSLIEENIEVHALDLSNAIPKIQRDVAFVHDTNKRLSLLKFLKKITKKVKILYYLINLLKIFYRYTKNVKLVFSKMKDVDVIIIGGGALIQDNALSFPTALAYIRTLNLFLNKPIYILGCSVGKQYSILGKYFIMYFLRGTKRIYLRDPQSVELLYDNFNLKANLIPDHALRISYNKEFNHKSKRYSCGINILEFASHGLGNDIDFKKEYYNYFKFLVKELVNRKEIEEIVLFSTGEKSDASAIIRFKNELINELIKDGIQSNKIKVFFPNDYKNLLYFMSEMDVLFNSRLHASILGIVAGTPILSIIWDPKVQGFYKLCGLENKCFYPHVKNIETSIKELYDSLANKMIYRRLRDKLSQVHKSELKSLLLMDIQSSKYK